jgi:hypothetical protein
MRRANTAKDKPETTMTRFFIAGIAALFLATEAAHAGQCEIWPEQELCQIKEFDCGHFLGGNLQGDRTTKDVTLNFEINFSENRERHLPNGKLLIQYDIRTGKLWINGKQCKWSK